VKKILITGGLGYLGGRIALRLLENSEYKITLTSRQHFQAQPSPFIKSQIIKMNLMCKSEIADACNGINYIIHLAAMNEIESQKDPESAVLINTLGTFRLLEQAEREGVEKFIYFSTAHVYGAPLSGHITEKSVPRPVHPYAITHKAAEDFVLASHDKQTLCGIVIRLSNGFGAPVSPEAKRWTLVVNDLCKQAVITKKLVLHSSGLQKRDFIPLHDVANTVSHLLALPEDKINDGLFNLGGENVMSILEIAEKISECCLKVLGFKPLIEKPSLTGPENIQEFVFDTTKLKSTGFALQGNIDQEIENTLLFCRETFRR
jgi:UDP-glucose 4-epimerase